MSAIVLVGDVGENGFERSEPRAPVVVIGLGGVLTVLGHIGLTWDAAEVVVESSEFGEAIVTTELVVAGLWVLIAFFGERGLVCQLGGGGPTGKPGDASGTQQVIAWGLLAGVGYAGYRRFSDGPTISQVASKAPQAISNTVKRLPVLRGGR